ncbi:MAG TPA: hypothetical protein VGY31_05005 [Terriglobia bacterium]|nr:hypothetical protein [Terriglobia bacterium]
MNKRSSTFLLLALYGTLLFNYGAPAPANEQAVNSPPAAQSSSQPHERTLSTCSVGEKLDCSADCRGFCPSQDFQDTLSGYFGPEESLMPANGSDPLGVPAAIINQHELQFVIVTVPDPIHTRLSLSFDESVTAVEQAATDAGYLFARAAIPWDNAQHPEPSNFVTRLEEKGYKQAKENIPGLMIFRNTRRNGIEESLLVFLVGELPTAGINKQQFRYALRAIQLMSPPASQDESWLCIVGPTFSGSLYSLGEILKHDDVAKSFLPRLKIVSGTVTSAQAIRWFGNSYNHFPPLFTLGNPDDEDKLQRLKDYVTGIGYDPAQVVELSEDETAPGVSLSKEGKFEYPRDIASLRAAYEQELRRQEIAEAQGKRPPRTSLRLNLADTGSDDDSIATYSPAQTPLSEEEDLKGIVSKLRARHAHYVVVYATNTLDSLFLARYLRSAYPQGRIVTVAANRLFDDDAGRTSMRGMLSFASPHLWASQAAYDFRSGTTKTPREGQPITFDSERAVHVYDAMVYALRFPFSRTEPYRGLWLAVLGRDGFWPLAPLSLGQSASWRFKIHPTISWMFLYFAGILAAAIYILLSWWGSIRARTSAMVAFAPVKNATRSWLLCIFAWLLLLAMLAIFAPALLPGGVSGVGGVALKVVGWGTVVLLITSTLFDLRRREVDHADASRLASVKQAWFWFVAISAALVISYFTFCPVMLHDNPQAGNLFLYRYIHLSSGVSPLLPWVMLLAAALWWAWYGLKGMVLLDGRRPRLPDEKDFPINRNPSYMRFTSLCDSANQRLLGAARPLTRDIWVYFPALGGTIIVWLVLVATQPSSHFMIIHGVEAWWLDFAYEVALDLVLFGIACTLTQMGLTWVASRNLLRGLDRLPLRRGFDGLKEFSWHPIWQLSAGGENDLNTVFMREMESLTHLRNTPELASKSPDFAAAIEGSQRCLDTLLRDFAPPTAKQNEEAARGIGVRKSAWRRWLQDRKEKANDESNKISTFEDLRKQLALTCGEGLKLLLSTWEKEDGLISFEPPDAAKDKLDKKTYLYVKVTEQFICLVFMNYIFMGLRQVRNLVTIVAGMFVFVALSLSSYPFEPKTTLRSFMLLLLFALATAAAVIYAQMHRDPILSRITGTTPGKLGGDFWLRLASAVGLPLLGLLAYQFPQVSNLLFSWLEPALQAIK